ncbi:hypothetical protein T06_5628 [Trichinella sp. T6]|nr:hypothetical protein T06_5628 [Trichinella sp. T6]
MSDSVHTALQITLRQSISAGARIDLSCGLCRLMKPVLIPTERGVSMAFSRRPSLPLISHKFHSFTNKQVAVHPSILFLIAMDYVIIYSCHSQIAFPTVLMFFLVTQCFMFQCVTVKTRAASWITIE